MLLRRLTTMAVRIQAGIMKMASEIPIPGADTPIPSKTPIAVIVNNRPVILNDVAVPARTSALVKSELNSASKSFFDVVGLLPGLAIQREQ
jgi:hypothetical protein